MNSRSAGQWNAASSIALRNAILKGIPKAIWHPLYLEAREAAIGNVELLADRRGKMMEHFAKMGIVEEDICRWLDVSGVELIGPEQMLLLKGVATAIKDGETTPEQAFELDVPGGGKVGEGESVKDKVRRGKSLKTKDSKSRTNQRGGKDGGADDEGSKSGKEPSSASTATTSNEQESLL